MPEAPLVSTVIAIGLIPVAFLLLHAFLSGRGKWPFHKITGLAAITWDLSMSFFYMILRALGMAVEGTTLEIKGAILVYFIVHGIIAVVVIALELSVLTLGLLQWRRGKRIKYHGILARILFVLWWFAFLSGEVFYLVVYVL